MKRLIFTILISITTAGAFAQNTTTDSTNTTKADSIKTKKGVKVKLGFGKDATQVSVNDKDRV